MRYPYLLFLTLSSLVFARPRLPGLTQIPTADVLPHGMFHLSASLNYFTGYDFPQDTILNPGQLPTEIVRKPYTAGVVLGFDNRAQFGIQFGSELSASFKAYVYESSGKDLFPDVIIGARSLFSSQEGRLFWVTDNNDMRQLKNEAFLALSTNLSTSTRVHTSASVLPFADKGKESLSFGLEQYMGSGVYFGYEAFQRYNIFHHGLTALLKVKEYFLISVTLTELQTWVKQEEQWGFYLKPAEPQKDGYSSPGIKVSVSIGGWALRNERVTDRERLKKLEQQQAKTQGDLKKLIEVISENQQNIERLLRRRSEASRSEDNQVSDYLDMIKRKITSDMPYDPADIQDLRNKIIELKGSARIVLKKIVTNPATDVDHRAQACIIMGIMGRGEFTEPLLKATADPEAKVRKEAILAIGRMKLQIGMEYARTLLDDTDFAVQAAAAQAINMIKEAAGVEIQEKQQPSLP